MCALILFLRSTVYFFKKNVFYKSRMKFKQMNFFAISQA